MPAILRGAKLEDADDIVRVLRASRLRYLPFAPLAHSVEEDLRWVTGTLIPAGGVTVASIGESVVGVLAVRQSEGVSWIDQMYVDPEYCGQGIGTKLLSEALNVLPTPVRLYTFQENEGARQFYERSGFRAVAFGDGSANEEGCPDVLYEYGGGVEPIGMDEVSDA